MDHDADCPLSGDDRLTALLFRLPAELRVEIYKLCLPQNRHFLNVFSDHSELEWLSTSRTIFQDAASLAYSGTGIYFDLEPHAPSNSRNVEPAFQSHIQTTFEHDKEWACDVIRSTYVKKVMLEIWCAFFDDIGDLLFWLLSTATQLGRFTAMEDLCIGLRDQCIAPKDATMLPFHDGILNEGYGTAARKSAYLREICRLMRRIKCLLPVGCKVRWSLPGEILPEVSFLRDNMPEQAPTRKERMITQFLGDVALFLESQSSLQLDRLLADGIT